MVQRFSWMITDVERQCNNFHRFSIKEHDSTTGGEQTSGRRADKLMPVGHADPSHEKKMRKKSQGQLKLLSVPPPESTRMLAHILARILARKTRMKNSH